MNMSPEAVSLLGTGAVIGVVISGLIIAALDAVAVRAYNKRRVERRINQTIFNKTLAPMRVPPLVVKTPSAARAAAGAIFTAVIVGSLVAALTVVSVKMGPAVAYHLARSF